MKNSQNLPGKPGASTPLSAPTCSGWLIPETAPRDGTQILGDFGWPWPCVAAWDEYDEYWVVCNLQQCPMEDGPINTYFETDTEGRDQLRRWMPMPDLQNDQDHTRNEGSEE